MIRIESSAFFRENVTGQKMSYGHYWRNGNFVAYTEMYLSKSSPDNDKDRKLRFL